MGPILPTQEQETESKSLSKLKMPTFTEVAILNKTLFLLDWDDTLMCTSFITKKKLKLSASESEIVEHFGSLVSQFLTKCKKLGTVIIITNSNESWVKKTAFEYMKMKEQILKDIFIISTRDIFENQDVSKKDWKKIVFEKLLEKYEKKIKNLVCASDLPEDIEIFKNLIKQHKKNNINISTVKFKYNPSIIVMIKEIQTMIKDLNELISSNKNYSLYEEKEEKETFSLGLLLDIFKF